LDVCTPLLARIAQKAAGALWTTCKYLLRRFIEVALKRIQDCPISLLTEDVSV
jgi:hypothetical protein